MPTLLKPDHPAIVGTHRGPVRITFLIGSLDVGGAERQLVRLANMLDPLDFEPQILTLWAGGPLLKDVRPGLRVTHLNAQSIPSRDVRWRSLSSVRMLVAMYRHLKKTQPTILHAYLPAAYMLGAVAGRAAAVPLIVAGRRGLASYRAYSQLRWRVMGRLANKLIDLHVCNSEAVRTWAVQQEGVNPKTMVVIPNGVDLPEVAGTDLEPVWRAPFTIAMIANFFAYKGHATVLRAVALVVRTHPELKLVLFGDGVEREASEQMCADLGIDGKVIFAGRRPNASHYLSNFDLAVLGSAHEGFPNALMEAMAAELPVVATAVGGIPELVRDGVHGLLVQPDDPTSMAAAITWMIEHREGRRLMGAAAKEHVAAHFGTSTMVRQTAEVYEALLATRLGPPAGRASS